MDENALSNLIISAAIEVHKQLGPGLLENSYQAAMECELSLRKIPYERQKSVPVFYKGHPLNIDYRLDFLVGKLVVVELKTKESQVIFLFKMNRLCSAFAPFAPLRLYAHPVSC